MERDINEEFMNKFVAQVSDIVETKAKESEARFGILVEDVKEDMRAWGDQFNTINSKLDVVIKDVEEMKDDISEMKGDISEMKTDIYDLKQDSNQVKKYLMDNLEPRINILESVVQ